MTIKAESEINKKTPFSVPYSPPVVFYTDGEARAWIEANESAFSWLENLNLKTESPFREMKVTYKNFLNEGRKAIRTVDSFITRSLETRTEPDQPLPSRSDPVPREIRDYLKKWSQVGLVCAHAPEAQFLSLLMNKDMTSITDIEQKNDENSFPLSLSFLSMECQKLEREKNLIKTIEQINGDNDKKVSALTQSFTALNDEASKFTKQIELCHTELENFKKGFEESIILASPVKHWETLVTDYNRKAWHAAIAIICAMIFTVTALGLYGLSVFQMTEPLYGLGMGLVMATLCIWFIRIISKYYVSNLHLSIDARERATMTKAYLALMEKKSPNEVERTLFYHTVFRPCSTGMVREDGPQTPSDIVCKLIEHLPKKEVS